MVERLKHKWSMLFTVSFSIFVPSLLVISNFLREHPSYMIVVPLWFSWAYYLVPAASITYDLWRLLVLNENPWKRTEIRLNWGNLLIFGLVTFGAWLFTHSWVILIPLTVSTLLYGLNLAKTVYIILGYPASIGTVIVFEFYTKPELLFLGEALLMVYFLLLKHVLEMTKHGEELSHGNA